MTPDSTHPILMIVCVASNRTYKEESINSIKYAHKSMNIKPVLAALPAASARTEEEGPILYDVNPFIHRITDIYNEALLSHINRFIDNNDKMISYIQSNIAKEKDSSLLASHYKQLRYLADELEFNMEAKSLLVQGLSRHSYGSGVARIIDEIHSHINKSVLHIHHNHDNLYELLHRIQEDLNPRSEGQERGHDCLSLGSRRNESNESGAPGGTDPKAGESNINILNEYSIDTPSQNNTSHVLNHNLSFNNNILDDSNTNPMSIISNDII